MTQLYFEDVKVGDSLTPFVRKTELLNFNRFAAVNDEFVAVHMDEQAAIANGFPRLYGMGALRTALLHVMLREWAGDAAFLVRVAIQHRGINYRDDVLTFTGSVTAKSTSDRGTVDVAVEARTDGGELSAKGSATVRFPSRPVASI